MQSHQKNTNSTYSPLLWVLGEKLDKVHKFLLKCSAFSRNTGMVLHMQNNEGNCKQINGLKGRNCKIVSIDVEESFDKNPKFFHDKRPEKARSGRNIYQPNTDYL